MVYIIETRGGKLYTGITNDLGRRWAQHSGERSGGAKFFRSDPPKQVRWQKKCRNRSYALKLEAKIKKLKRPDKLLLIKR